MSRVAPARPQGAPRPRPARAAPAPGTALDLAVIRRKCYCPAMFLNHFDPSDIAPDILVDREDDVSWVRSNFESYFDAIEQRTLNDAAKRIVCVTGRQGDREESILAAKVVQGLRKKYSGSTLFVSVDCRGTNGARDVIASIASQGSSTRSPRSRRSSPPGGSPFPPWLQALAPACSRPSPTRTLPARRRSTSSSASTGPRSSSAASRCSGRSRPSSTSPSRGDEGSGRDRDHDHLRRREAPHADDPLLRGHPRRRGSASSSSSTTSTKAASYEYWDEDARKNTEATVKRVLKLYDAPIATRSSACAPTSSRSCLALSAMPRQLEDRSTAARAHPRSSTTGSALEAGAVQSAMRSDAARTVIGAFAERGHRTARPAHVGQVGRREQGRLYQPDRRPRAEVAGRALRRLQAHDRGDAEALRDEARIEGDDAVTRKELLAAVGDDEEAFRYLQTTEARPPARLLGPHALRPLRPERRLDRRFERLMWILGRCCDEPRTSLRFEGSRRVRYINAPRSYDVAEARGCSRAFCAMPGRKGAGHAGDDVGAGRRARSAPGASRGDRSSARTRYGLSTATRARSCRREAPRLKSRIATRFPSLQPRLGDHPRPRGRRPPPSGGSKRT